MGFTKNIKLMDKSRDKKVFEIKTDVGSKDLEKIFNMTRTVESEKKKDPLTF
jgi:hypothetical protein